MAGNLTLKIVLSSTTIFAAILTLSACQSSSDNTSAQLAGSAIPIEVGGAFTEVNTPYISVTICIPGTQTCETIPKIKLDSGSSGLRLNASAIHITPSQELNTSGGKVSECWEFGGGMVLWGSVALVDVILGSEKASNVPVQVIDPSFAQVPSDCSNSTADTYENGIIGISPANTDCGGESLCSSIYYSCAGNEACVLDQIPENLRVRNPISLMPQNNNGATISFPSVPPMGAQQATGSLFLGVGTNSANQPSSGTTAFRTDHLGWFNILFQGSTYTTQLDTGTTYVDFPTAVTISDCSSYGWSGPWLCPSTTMNLSATFKSIDGAVSRNVDFDIINAETALPSGAKVLNDIGMQWGGLTSNSLNLGLPFFFGKTVYIGLDKKTSPLGLGPFYAY